MVKYPFAIAFSPFHTVHKYASTYPLVCIVCCLLYNLLTCIQFEYRLTVSPELCLGLFCTIVPDNANGVKLSTFPPSHPVETGRKDGARSVLLAHIVATRTDGMFVTDEAMDYPRDFRVSKHNTSGLGHNDTGSTVCIHSLAVHPELQGCGLGRLIMKSYLQQLKNSEIAESCALICQNVSDIPSGISSFK